MTTARKRLLRAGRGGARQHAAPQQDERRIEAERSTTDRAGLKQQGAARLLPACTRPHDARP